MYETQQWTLHICTNVQVYTHTHMNACAGTHIHTYLYIHSHTEICVHTHIHTQVHIHTHTCTIYTLGTEGSSSDLYQWWEEERSREAGRKAGRRTRSALIDRYLKCGQIEVHLTILAEETTARQQTEQSNRSGHHLDKSFLRTRANCRSDGLSLARWSGGWPARIEDSSTRAAVLDLPNATAL